MRLSSNWLVSRISYVFVEFMRNVPVLIHILAFYALVVTLLPPVKKAIDVGAGAFFLSNRGFYTPSPVFEPGSGMVGIAIILAIVVALVFRRWAKQVQDRTGKSLSGFLDLDSYHYRSAGYRLPCSRYAVVLGHSGAQGF